MPKKIGTHSNLEVYQIAMDLAMSIFETSKRFPREETYALTDQIRRSSRSVCANLAEAWRKRRYPAAFVSKLSDAEAKAAETQVWIEFVAKCDYASRRDAASLYAGYNRVIGKIVTMVARSDSWTFPNPPITRNSRST